MKPVIFLVSGNGGNLKFIYHAIRILNLPLTLSLVISDRDCGAINFAKKICIPSFRIDYKKGEPHSLNNILEKVKPSLVITNFHKILAASTLSLNHEFVNLHYSILPAFKGFIGMQPVDEAEKINCRFIGASTHRLIDDVDSGSIIQQGLFGVDWTLQKSAIYDTVFKIGCLILLNSLLEKRIAPLVNRILIDKKEIYLSEALGFNYELLFEKKIWTATLNDTL
jgi:phosphoribosylglycinamide formyltransferase-1